MPATTDAPQGAPVWIEISTSNPDATTSFYGDLFGWTVDVAGDDMGGYMNFSYNDLMVAGGMKTQAPEQPDAWLVYLAVADATATAEAVTAHGGSVMVPPMDVMDLGTMAVFLDPSGAAIGAWRPGTHRGILVSAEPNSPSWFELHTRDFDAATAFYRDAFGWPLAVMSDTEEFRYATHGEGADMKAGIMDAAGHLPEGMPSYWAVYFQVADADAAVVRATELGGTVLEAPADSPYGRLATIADPNGAVFRFQQPPA